MGDPEVTMGFNTQNGLLTWMIWGYHHDLGNHHLVNGNLEF